MSGEPTPDDVLRAIAATRRLVRLAREVFEAAEAEGFSEEQAMAMTLTWLQVVAHTAASE